MFGFGAVRGSSSRGAREGLLGLKDVIESGRTAIFTADGPRGPIYQTKMGPIKLAQMTGAPIGAFHLEPEHAWTMRSWDRFLVPKPFTRIVVSWAQWTRVPPICLRSSSKRKREELNAAIERARLRALAHFGKARPDEGAAMSESARCRFRFRAARGTDCAAAAGGARPEPHAGDGSRHRRAARCSVCGVRFAAASQAICWC